MASSQLMSQWQRGIQPFQLVVAINMHSYFGCCCLVSHFVGATEMVGKRQSWTSSLCNTKEVLAQLVNITHQWMASQSRPPRSVYSGSTGLGRRTEPSPTHIDMTQEESLTRSLNRPCCPMLECWVGGVVNQHLTLNSVLTSLSG